MHRSAFVSPQNMLLWDIRGDDLYHVPPSNPNPGFLVPMDAAFLFSKVAELHVKHGHSLTTIMVVNNLRAYLWGINAPMVENMLCLLRFLCSSCLNVEMIRGSNFLKMQPHLTKKYAHDSVVGKVVAPFQQWEMDYCTVCQTEDDRIHVNGDPPPESMDGESSNPHISSRSEKRRKKNKSKKSKKVIQVLTIVDVYSSYLWAFQCDRQSGQHVKNSLDSLFRELGRKPVQISCDNGSPFVCEEVTSFLAESGVKYIQSRVRHPQSQGCVERLQGVVYGRTKKYGNEPNFNAVQRAVSKLQRKSSQGSFQRS